MIEIATESLQDDVIDEYRKIQHKPLGLVMIIPAWNYPYLISINSLIPSLLAGNAVLFKGSSQTPSVGKFYQECLEVAGLHPNLFLNLYILQYFHFPSFFRIFQQMLLHPKNYVQLSYL